MPKIRKPNGGFTQAMHAVFDKGVQLTHWDSRKDNTLSAFWCSQQGRDLRSGKIPKDTKRFELRTRAFITPPRLKKEAA